MHNILPIALVFLFMNCNISFPTDIALTCSNFVIKGNANNVVHSFWDKSFKSLHLNITMLMLGYSELNL